MRDGVAEFIGAERFFQRRARSRLNGEFKAIDDRETFTAAGHREDLDPGELLPHLPNQFYAIHLAHDDVRHQHIEGSSAKQVEGIAAVGSQCDLVAAIFQDLTDDVPHDLVIIYD